MAERRLAAARPTDVACERCGAAAGAACTNGGTREDQVHAVRRDHYRQLVAELRKLVAWEGGTVT